VRLSTAFSAVRALARHFDEAEFTTTVSLQQAESGGDFEFSGRLRNASADMAFESVAAIVNARSTYDVEPRAAKVPKTAVAPFAPGALQIFAGRYSLHRVSPIAGKTPRLVGVFCFSKEAGFVNSPSVQQMFWGRTLQSPPPHSPRGDL